MVGRSDGQQRYWCSLVDLRDGVRGEVEWRDGRSVWSDGWWAKAAELGVGTSGMRRHLGHERVLAGEARRGVFFTALSVQMEAPVQVVL